MIGLYLAQIVNSGLALGAVYGIMAFWGSTFVVLRIALTTLSPLQTMINLDPYLPAPEAPAKGAETKAQASDGGPAHAKRTAKPDAAAMRKMPALDIRAKVGGISKGGLQVKDIILALKGEKGRYNLTSLTASLGSGGAVKATGSMYSSRLVSASASASAEELKRNRAQMRSRLA